MSTTEQEMRQDLRRRLAGGDPAPVDVPLSRQVPGFVEVVPATTPRGRARGGTGRTGTGRPTVQATGSGGRNRPRGAPREPAPLTETEQRAELASRLARSQLPEERGAFNQLARTATGGFIAGMISIPHAAGELLAMGDALVTGTAAAAIPGGRGFEFGERRAAAEQQFPANALRMFPNPSARDVLETVETVRQLPGELAATPGSPIRAVGRAAETAEVFEAAQAEASPVGTVVGEVLADVAALVTLKPKISSSTAKMGERLKTVPGRLRNFFRGPNAKPPDPVTMRQANEAIEQLADATGMGERISRIPGRVGEAAFEAALIGALGEADPAETAMWGAGVQAGGSIAMAGRSWILNHRLTSVGAFGTIWMGHEMWRAAFPGPQRAGESKDEAIREMVFTYGAAFVAGVLGSHRGIGQGNMRKITETFGTASRAAVASFAEELDLAVRNDKPHVPQVVGIMMQNPDALGSEARILIERAAEQGEGAMTRTIDSLWKNGGFRNRFDTAVEDLQIEQAEADRRAGGQLNAGQQ